MVVSRLFWVACSIYVYCQIISAEENEKITCKETELLYKRTCIDVCEQVRCSNGGKCIADETVAVTFHNCVCRETEILNNGTCVDVCKEITCSVGKKCVAKKIGKRSDSESTILIPFECIKDQNRRQSSKESPKKSKNTEAVGGETSNAHEIQENTSVHQNDENNTSEDNEGNGKDNIKEDSNEHSHDDGENNTVKKVNTNESLKLEKDEASSVRQSNNDDNDVGGNNVNQSDDKENNETSQTDGNKTLKPKSTSLPTLAKQTAGNIPTTVKPTNHKSHLEGEGDLPQEEEAGDIDQDNSRNQNPDINSLDKKQKENPNEINVTPTPSTTEAVRHNPNPKSTDKTTKNAIKKNTDKIKLTKDSEFEPSKKPIKQENETPVSKSPKTNKDKSETPVKTTPSTGTIPSTTKSPVPKTKMLPQQPSTNDLPFEKNDSSTTKPPKKNVDSTIEQGDSGENNFKPTTQQDDSQYHFETDNRDDNSFENVNRPIINPVNQKRWKAEQSSSSNGYFPVLFMATIALVVGGYFVYHNRTKVLGLIIEGRNASEGRGNRPSYQKLRNVEEAMPGLRGKGVV